MRIKRGPTIITLSLNAPTDTERTLKSISAQTTPPNRNLVIDSSDNLHAQAIENLCATYGAVYLWVPPQGIYPAMRHALSVLQEDEFCMFVNSGDWLMNENSLRAVRENLLRSGRDEAHWLIGGISMVSGCGNPIDYILDSTRADFGRQLRLGTIWLPHPSTIYRVSALQQVRPFEDRLKIASDYATGLRMFKKFGPPILTSQIISVFSMGGLSTSSPIRVQVENAIARLAAFGPSLIARETLRLTRFGVRYSLERLICFLDRAFVHQEEREASSAKPMK